jgi:hypothetical protein
VRFLAATPIEDHLPTHVHAVHSGDGWVARFRVAEAIMANLPACRENWWNTHGSRHEIGLVNRRVETRSIEGDDGVLARVALKPGRTATRIVSAGYDPGSGKIALTLEDGRTLSLTAGQHIEETEEW